MPGPRRSRRIIRGMLGTRQGVRTAGRLWALRPGPGATAPAWPQQPGPLPPSHAAPADCPGCSAAAAPGDGGRTDGQALGAGHPPPALSSRRPPPSCPRSLQFRHHLRALGRSLTAAVTRGGGGPSGQPLAPGQPNRHRAPPALRPSIHPEPVLRSPSHPVCMDLAQPAGDQARLTVHRARDLVALGAPAGAAQGHVCLRPQVGVARVGAARRSAPQVPAGTGHRHHRHFHTAFEGLFSRTDGRTGRTGPATSAVGGTQTRRPHLPRDTGAASTPTNTDAASTPAPRHRRSIHTCPETQVRCPHLSQDTDAASTPAPSPARHHAGRRRGQATAPRGGN